MWSYNLRLILLTNVIFKKPQSTFTNSLPPPTSMKLQSDLYKISNKWCPLRVNKHHTRSYTYSICIYNTFGQNVSFSFLFFKLEMFCPSSHCQCPETKMCMYKNVKWSKVSIQSVIKPNQCRSLLQNFPCAKSLTCRITYVQNHPRAELPVCRITSVQDHPCAESPVRRISCVQNPSV